MKKEHLLPSVEGVDSWGRPKIDFQDNYSLGFLSNTLRYLVNYSDKLNLNTGLIEMLERYDAMC